MDYHLVSSLIISRMMSSNFEKNWIRLSSRSASKLSSNCDLWDGFFLQTNNDIANNILYTHYMLIIHTYNSWACTKWFFRNSDYMHAYPCEFTCFSRMNRAWVLNSLTRLIALANKSGLESAARQCSTAKKEELLTPPPHLMFQHNHSS